MTNWWEGFFDAKYLELWGAYLGPEKTQREVDGLWALLGLKEGSRVLDAPCGQGRLSRPLAARGAVVLGVDQSADLLAAAEGARSDLPETRLRYLRQDLRQPLAEDGFDAAFNVFSSLGYGSEADDLAILANLRRTVKPGGFVFLDTAHRDMLVARFAFGRQSTDRLADGTLCVEEARFDPIAGRVESTWYWAGPGGQGKKPASLRVYTITELVRLLEQAGLRFLSAHQGCVTTPFDPTAPMGGGRVGLLTRRE
jgi:SAM-dependent methyltransferase